MAISNGKYAWQSFTERARIAVFAAELDAEKLGCAQIDSRCILLGLLRDEHSLASWLLSAIGVQVPTIRKKLTGKTRTRSDLNSVMTMSDDGRLSLALAFEEAAKLGNRHIGTEHLLLGSIRAARSDVARTLRRHSVSAERIRSSIQAIRKSHGGDLRSGREVERSDG